MLAIRDELRSSITGLYSTFRKAFLSPQVRLFFTASLYEAFELQMACETACMSQHPDDDDARTARSVIDQALLQTLRAIEEVSPGSDLHAILAARCVVS